MPDADSRFNPPSASNSSASDEATQLELHLQRQLEEDVARIFDESLYSDLEVVCGKLKILTHSCILKARTKKFYHKLQTFLHLNIARSTFDEIYSFISDTYTECDIKHQEKEILEYLKSVPIYSLKSKTEHREELEEFLTPKCISPYVEKTLKKSISSSPSTELTKEYYALVPIEGNFLEKELIEQDVLSTAFQTIISSQSGDLEKTKIIPCTKPTSLALASSHSSKTVKHSSSCDILKKSHHKDEKSSEIYKKIVKETITIPSQNIKANLELRRTSATGVESVYSPDSLVIDDPSSSSDYLSAYTFSPGLGSACQTQLNVGDTTKMENIFTSSDSGLENTGMLESLTSHKDITMTDMSLTESTLHDLTADDGSNSHDSTSSPIVEKRNNFHNNTEDILSTEVNSSSDQLNKQKEQSSSSKEEKQRQNEEIVILESSSLSSETGSWESVFPPKLPIKDACVKFIQTERQHFHGIYNTEKQSPVQKSAFKSTSCFIDAASLVDEDATSSSAKLLMAIERLSFKQDELPTANPEALLPAPSQPVPCSTNKNDFSPNDWSENENEDSLEQLDNKDPDSIQKDLSPTIFEMTPITEDSLCANVFESGSQAEKPDSIKPIAEESLNLVKDGSISASTVLMSNTPHNSIMSIKANVLKQYESEESESDTTLVGRDNQGALKGVKKYNESSPIISGGASVEDHLPTIGSFTNSPLSRRRIENTQIVSGAYVPPLETGKQLKSPRLISSSAWTVDMSVESTEGEPKSYNRTGAIPKKLSAKTEKLRNSKSSKCHQNCSKSRSSVDSDSSDRSSHKFYIDFSSLPDDPIPSQNHYESEGTNEKNNMFSMYIDIGKNPVKEMPPKLISKKSSSSGAKNNSKSNQNKSTNDFAAVFTKIEAGEPCSTSIFEKYESLCDDPNISISEIISLNGRPGQNSANRNNKDLSVNELNKKSSSHNYQDAIQEEGKLFVKLSDLDKPVQKIDLPTAKNDNYHVLVERMTRSIPENNWSDQNQASTSRSNEVISSFHSENALSLNRLFPHLRNEFSRSMPGSLASRTRSPLRLGASSSPGDIEDQTSEASDMSSVQSSLCRSIVENSTTEETSQASSLIGNSQSRLGQDLLRMFLEEIAPDVIVEVSGRRIKAHKCILSSRCQYFAGILSGGWVESAGNVIALPPFSFNVVHFALCHIYSGVSTIPDTISIVELATLADMLGLEGLKEAIMFTLKAKYCHHFHRPCSVCTVGVLECFPLCSVYGLDDLYRKCLKWISKYFTRVWPTKSFATLPSELLEKCYQQVVVNITLETILETIMGCGLTVGSLHNSRWAEVVARMCRRLIHAAAHFVAPKLVTLLREISALPADPSRSALQALNECVVAAIEWAPPEECCRAYAFLAGVAREIRNCRFVKPDLITNGNNVLQRQDNLLYVHSNGWLLKCEGALVRAAPRVCCTQAFIELPHDLRRRLRELGCIMYGGQAQLPAPPERPPAQIRRSRSTHQSANGSAVSTSRNSEIDQMRASFVPYAPRPPTHVSAEIARPAIAEARSVPPIVRTTRAQEERAKFNLSKTNLSQERLNTRTSMRAPFENTRPRYLEPRQIQDNRKTSSNRTLQPRIMSSSESSRNSSPIQVRNLRTSRMKTRQIIDPNALALQAYSHDSLATSSRPRTAEPSTDSLSESQNSNRYATYTRSRHTTRGSVPAGPMHANKNPKPPTQTNSHLAPNSGRVRTKIPVYLNQVTRSNVDNKSHVESQKRQTHIGKTPTTTYNNTTSVPLRKINEKNSLCSLMSATKSSSAKMVTKVVKDSPRNKPAPKNTKNASKRQLRRAEVEPSEIPIMERSGTFLKDEPTFGDKTTNIDLDQ